MLVYTMITKPYQNLIVLNLEKKTWVHSKTPKIQCKYLNFLILAINSWQ